MASLLHAVRDGVLTRRPFAQQEWGNRSSELFIVGLAAAPHMAIARLSTSSEAV